MAWGPNIVTRNRLPAKTPLNRNVHIHELSTKEQHAKNNRDRSETKEVQDPANNTLVANCDYFSPQLATVRAASIIYTKNHFLGIPQEIRDKILEVLQPEEKTTSSRPRTGHENYQFACRQTYHETFSRWNYQQTVLVPANRSGEFIKRTLDVTVLHSNAYQNVKSLVLEIRHDATGLVFSQLAQVLRLSTQLEELRIFGVGPDGCGVLTSSTRQACGKHDSSVVAIKAKLHIDGQQYHRRLTLVNALPWLGALRVLVLDNLNMPLLQAHVLKNKPRLEKLFITADPRSGMHVEYRRMAGSIAGLIHLGPHDYSPIKELSIQSNAVFTASGITSRITSTLEVLDFMIPDCFYQPHARQINFLQESALLLQILQFQAHQLRELRVCVTGPLSEIHSDYAAFMGELKACVSRLPALQLVEIHIHSTSPWFAAELIEALPPSVTRFYLTDLFINRNESQLSTAISWKTGIPLTLTTEPDDDVNFKFRSAQGDSIQFGNSKLSFVGYEYDRKLDVDSANRQDEDMMTFIKLNGKLLDRERNCHLAHLKGKYIPFKEASLDEQMRHFTKPVSTDGLVPTEEAINSMHRELAECGLGDDPEYFGNEELAEMVFHCEPAAPGGTYSFPVIVEMDDEPNFCNHWLSK